ncbi:MAG: CDP-alcohol phosphatidyltransferase family protein [Candidatus Eisenbacteria bacterium]|uniref:CDP-alcohol phosphatidyltransferase family protein n=1 Tax=Eiseniibacteriota bacterium TaxID=2212470 RepID=A0A956M2P9_UNCEI|nr:CDP-alcohol phosphatidyltransferase family protein [Candidatus Eisenbacteria bacterium]
MVASPGEPSPDRAAAKGAEHARRTTKALLADPEKRVLTWIAARLPRWVLPDHLSLLALVGAAMIAACYMLSNIRAGWLWGANFGLFVHWLGDSLDGTLARHRKIERPKYGFYVDHLADALATVAIGVGLGVSPFMLLSVGFGIVIGYLVLSINVYLETIVRGQFRFGYGVIGPTEARILLILLNTIAVFTPPLDFSVTFFGRTVGLTFFDVLGTLGALGMILMLARRAIRNLRELAQLEPANRRRE